MKINKTVISLFIMLALLSGCSKDVVKDDLSDSTNSVNDGSNNETYAYSEDGTKVTELNLDKNLSAAEVLMQSPEFLDPASPLSKRTIYFEYDSSQVLNEFIAVIEAHAQYLMTNPNQRITLEGHSDERGTREYNIALAEQRAKSVFKMLKLIGVMGNQIDIVSYGEEKPVALEHNDDSYALNRRVEVVYK
ncbi:peptidoglycan-associated lipoprotein [Methylococcaceae bacterium HT4]|nr:peptidoglycan-associated lipoprotein Pal [Methyloprofundus sp.]TXK97045.1 peptidoglycan-associated lipoprotein [Methylococcaceae bacterium CS4]TXK99381.1 peptidoglycan-associated lipoprotein [Methylococcaceae bacterium CS5]TXL05026.1 peptidoglycan-associated lipoprotein [Methylococcaceae bacterium CS1]TXL05468.1 peptidoglycan-associated lipoprotein [Methylococcaceae bacterium CS3]TXL09996.1 peptidoglycan-associated lipoprotein [Methylococcaceae bacterium CS2]TXL14926.1 peptidoglycan-associ